MEANVIDTSARDRADWSPIAQKPDPFTGIRRHTPDPQTYHDASVIGLPSGAVMIPASTRNGASRGFSMNPNRVNIVTGENGEGFEVDLKGLSKDAMTAAIASVGMASDDPTDVYASLHRMQHMPQPQPVVPPAPAPQPYVPQPYVPQPPVGLTPPQLQPFVPVATAQAVPSQYSDPVPVPPPVLAVPTYTPPQPAQPAPDLNALIQHMMLQQAQLQQSVAALTVNAKAAPALNWKLEQQRMEEEARHQAEIQNQLNHEVAQPKEPVRQPSMVDIGFPYLTEPPSKPKVQVTFQMPDGSKFATRYHHVEKQGEWLYLYLDSRYECDRFTPPSGDRPLRLTLPQQDNREIQALLVPGAGVQHHGCLQVTAMLVSEDSADSDD